MNHTDATGNETRPMRYRVTFSQLAADELDELLLLVRNYAGGNTLAVAKIEAWSEFQS